MTRKKIVIVSIILSLLTIFVCGCIDLNVETGSKYIDGCVYDSNGDPVYYVNVDIDFKKSGSGQFTDENGYFNFSRSNGFPLETFTLTIKYNNSEEKYQYTMQKEMSPIEITLPISEVPNGSFCGYITDYAQKPITGVSVYESERDISTTTDENGLYCFENIEAGKIIIKINAEGYRSDTQHHTALIAFEPIRYLNISLATIGNDLGGINGTIVDEETKSPIENVEILMLLNGEIISTFSDENGYYYFSELSPTTGSITAYKLLVVKDGYIIDKLSADVSSNVTTLEDIELRLLGKYCSMGGFLIDDSGEPVDNAYFERSRFGSHSSSSASGGTYGGGSSWSSNLPSKYSIKITAEGYETLEDEVTLSEGLTLVKHYTLTKK